MSDVHSAIVRGLAEELGWECTLGTYDGEPPPGNIEAWEAYMDMAIGEYRWERDDDVAVVQIDGGQITFTCTWSDRLGHTDFEIHHVFSFLLADPNLIELVKDKLNGV